MNDEDLDRGVRLALVPAMQPTGELRRRVLGQLAEAGSSPEGSRRAGRPLMALGFALAAAAAVVAVQVLPGGSTGGTRAYAAGVLHDAAVVAASQDGAAPEGDQFVFTETMAAAPARSGSTTTVLTRIWRSADGASDGLVWTQVPNAQGRTQVPLPGCRDGKARSWLPDGQLSATADRACVAEPGFAAQLPANASAMTDYVRSLGPDVFAQVVTLLSTSYLTGPMRAALFDALAGLPDLHVIERVDDSAGRSGVAVYQGESQAALALIFDPATKQLLGWQVVGSASVQLRSTAILRQAVVDTAGQLP
ncbi:hypothetical protein HDA40_005516 [Hamadaea flava]|uniref:CU044_5270 family protein n=1 Tax=Hamadaea flava TaxID=1742688 RepID=A0ABV8LXD7_9ACTN|nr:CU044_5270 family protein [Hamadaea flava]MCP2327009.1 hypothetical protein [Hamadaea flava]